MSSDDPIFPDNLSPTAGKDAASEVHAIPDSSADDLESGNVVNIERLYRFFSN